MLNRLLVYGGYHIRAILESLRWMLQRPLASLMTILVIAIALSLPGVIWVFSDNVRMFTANWDKGGHISLYLSATTSKEALTSLMSQVNATPGVGSLRLISAEEGLISLQKQEGMQDIMRYLPENPLPHLIEVIPAVSVNTPQEVEQLYLQLKAYPSVEQAKIDMDWLTRIYVFIDFIHSLGHALLLLLAVAVILIVGNTLRMSIQSRREAVQILKLIGATDAYIIRPFLYSGIGYALFGALISIIMIDFLIMQLSLALNRFASLYDMHYPLHGLALEQILIIILIATILGWIGAKMSISGQISVMEPCN